MSSETGDNLRQSEEASLREPNVAEKESDKLLNRSPSGGSGTPDANDSRKAVQDGEKKAVGDTAAGKAAVAASTGVNPLIGGAVKLLGKIKTRKGAGTSVVVVLMILLIVGGSFLAGSLAPIAFMHNVMDDLNDQLAALDIRQEKLLRTKIKATQAEFINGCETMSIRCKLRSVSNRDVKRLKKVGITVEGKTIGTRTFPNEKGYTLEVDGQVRSVSASELADLFKSNVSVGNRFRTALNMKYFGFSDKAFKWFMDKVGISKAKPTLKGSTLEEKLANFSKGTTADSIPAGAKFVQVEDENGNTVYQLEGEVGDTYKTYTQAEVDAIKSQNSTFTGAGKTMPKPLAQIANIVNVVGYADLACTAKNMIGAAAVAAKYAKAIQLAKYAAPVAASAYAINAGDGTPEDSEVVGRFFMDTDNRKTIIDTAATIQQTPGIGTNAPIADVTAAMAKSDGVQVANPYYGKNATDSSLAKLSVADASLNSGFNPTPATAKYSLSFSGTAAAILGGVASLFSAIPITSDKACEIIQNWAVRTVGFVVGVIALFYGGGGLVIQNTQMFLLLTAVMYGATKFLESITSGKAVDDDIVNKPEEKAAALWTGLAYTSSATPQLRGMIPGSETDLVEYAAERQRVATTYKQMETASVGFFDTSSANSVVSQLALKMYDNRPTDASATSLLASAGSILSAGFASTFSGSTAYATNLNHKRLQLCDDKEYAALGVAADVQCNLRYYLPKEDLARDPDETAVWMEQNGYVAKDTETGMPTNYTPPSPTESSNMVQQFLSGVVNSFYDTRNYGSMSTDATPKGAEYAKFLDYCVYRSMPYGKTFEESGAFGSAEAGWKDGSKCLEKNEVLSHFRTYTFDRSNVDITDEVPNDSAAGSAAIGGGTVTTAEIKALAQQLLDLEKAGKITFGDYADPKYKAFDRNERTLASQQIEDMAAGKAVSVSTRCGFTIAPITPDPKLLQFLVELGGQYHYTINTLFGQCHVEDSNHYKGKAVDFGCPADTAIIDQIGSKYGISHNNESCSVSPRHWHYSVGGH